MKKLVCKPGTKKHFNLMSLHVEFIPFLNLVHKFLGEKQRAASQQREFVRHLNKQLMHYLTSLFCFSGQCDGNDGIFSFGHG